MSDIINLRQARKSKARITKEQAAAQNRVIFGQTKANKALATAQSALANSRLNGARLDQEGDT